MTIPLQHFFYPAIWIPFHYIKPWSLSSLLSCFLPFIHYASCILLFFLLFMHQSPWNFPIAYCVLNELYQVLIPVTFSWETVLLHYNLMESFCHASHYLECHFGLFLDSSFVTGMTTLDCRKATKTMKS